MPGVSVEADATPSPLVGEDKGGGPAASAAERILIVPPPNPPHKGEGFKRLNLRATAIERARDLRRNMTDAEKLLWAGLRQAFPHSHWRRQVPIGPYFADFCSHSAKLIIEVDGGQHSPEADAVRTRFLERQGYRVDRCWNHDVLHNVEGVLTMIAALLPRPVEPAQ